MSTQPTAPEQDTPRTNALRGTPMTRADSDDFARTLERELAAAKAEIARLNQQVGDQSTSMLELMKMDREHQDRALKAEADNAQLRAEVERLKQDLREDRHLAKLADENLVLMKRIAEPEAFCKKNDVVFVSKEAPTPSQSSQP